LIQIRAAASLTAADGERVLAGAFAGMLAQAFLLSASAPIALAP
jgi:hypothetical protein